MFENYIWTSYNDEYKTYPNNIFKPTFACKVLISPIKGYWFDNLTCK